MASKQYIVARDQVKPLLFSLVGLSAFVIAFLVVRVIWLKQPSQEELNAASIKGLIAARDRFKPTLPKKVDEATTLIDLKVDGMNLTYVNEIGTQYQLNNMLPLQMAVTREVCASEMKAAMRNGVSYTYEYWSPSPERKFWGRFRIPSCT